VVKSFHVDASLMGLWRKHVDHVQLDGLDISIPPKQVRVQQKEAKRAADAADTEKKPEATPEQKRNDPLKDGGVVLDRVDTDDARLIMVPGRPDKAPKIWAIHHLRMHDLGSTHSWPFEATLTNGVPPGEIQVKGGFGPWDRNEPGDTALDGSFNFEKADLGVFKGISGTLASHGSFGGTLDQLEAYGETDTPDFTIKVGGHPFPLHVNTRRSSTAPTATRACRTSTRGSSARARRGAVLDGPKGERGDRLARCRDGQVARRRHHDDGGEVADAADDRRLKLERSFCSRRATATSSTGCSSTDISDRAGDVHQLRRAGEDRGMSSAPPRRRGGEETTSSELPGQVQARKRPAAPPELTFECRARVQLAGGYARGRSARFHGSAAPGRENLRNGNRHEVGAPQGARPAVQAERRLGQRHSDTDRRFPLGPGLWPGPPARAQKGQLTSRPNRCSLNAFPPITRSEQAPCGAPRVSGLPQSWPEKLCNRTCIR
jgi:hypothetical protein